MFRLLTVCFYHTEVLLMLVFTACLLRLVSIELLVNQLGKLFSEHVIHCNVDVVTFKAEQLFT